MSDQSIDMEAQSPAHTPAASPTRPLPARPFETPISPRSALIALSLAGDDENVLRSITQGLIATIQKHKTEVRNTIEAKNARISKLEQTLGGYIPTNVAPDGYEENNETRAPRLVIPIQDSFYQPAHWVKQLDDGRVAAYLKNYTITDAPFICEIYTGIRGADDSDDDPILPMQPWLIELLTGPTTHYNTLYKEVQRRSNWETLAELQRFRELQHSIHDIQARIDFLHAEIRGTKQAQDASQGRLEAARLDRTAANLRTLPAMPKRNFGEFRQKGKRGRQ
jgi:hypothetical protein